MMTQTLVSGGDASRGIKPFTHFWPKRSAAAGPCGPYGLIPECSSDSSAHGTNSMINLENRTPLSTPGKH